MTKLATTRKAASASAARCSALPWPYWCVTSAGRTATPTAKKVSSAATRSVPEWMASETRPRLCVARPVASLSAISAAAASTDQRAVLRCGSIPCKRTPAPRGSDPLERPGDDVLSLGDVADRLAAQLERRDRGEVDLGLRRAQQPGRMVDLGPVQPGGVARVQAVPLGKEPLERVGRRRRGRGARRPVAPREDPAALAEPGALDVGPAVGLVQRDARVEVREPVLPP